MPTRTTLTALPPELLLSILPHLPTLADCASLALTHPSLFLPSSEFITSTLTRLSSTPSQTWQNHIPAHTDRLRCAADHAENASTRLEHLPGYTVKVNGDAAYVALLVWCVDPDTRLLASGVRSLEVVRRICVENRETTANIPGEGTVELMQGWNTLWTSSQREEYLANAERVAGYFSTHPHRELLDVSLEDWHAHYGEGTRMGQAFSGRKLLWHSRVGLGLLLPGVLLGLRKVVFGYRSHRSDDLYAAAREKLLLTPDTLEGVETVENADVRAEVFLALLLRSRMRRLTGRVQYVVWDDDPEEVWRGIVDSEVGRRGGGTSGVEELEVGFGMVLGTTWWVAGMVGLLRTARRLRLRGETVVPRVEEEDERDWAELGAEPAMEGLVALSHTLRERHADTLEEFSVRFTHQRGVAGTVAMCDFSAFSRLREMAIPLYALGDMTVPRALEKAYQRLPQRTLESLELLMWSHSKRMGWEQRYEWDKETRRRYEREVQAVMRGIVERKNHHGEFTQLTEMSWQRPWPWTVEAYEGDVWKMKDGVVEQLEDQIEVFWHERMYVV